MRKSAGFTYIEVLVTFSLTIFMLALILSLSGDVVREAEQDADQLRLQREASALHFLLLNEIRQGYNFHVLAGNLLFQLDEWRAVKLEYTKAQQQLVRRLSRSGVQGPFEGHVVLSRYVDSVTFYPDDDGEGVEIRVHFKHRDAELTLQTYWHSRIEQDEV